VRAEIHRRPQVMCDCQCADFHETKLAQTNFIKNPHTQFRENSTNGLSTEDREQTDSKERLKLRREMYLFGPGGLLSTE